MPAQGFVILSSRWYPPQPSCTGQSFGRYRDLVQNHCFDLVLGAAPARLDGDIYREGVSGGTEYHKMLYFLCVNNSANRNPNTPITGAPNRRFPRRRVSPKRLLESRPPGSEQSKPPDLGPEWLLHVSAALLWQNMALCVMLDSIFYVRDAKQLYPETGSKSCLQKVFLSTILLLRV